MGNAKQSLHTYIRSCTILLNSSAPCASPPYTARTYRQHCSMQYNNFQPKEQNQRLHQPRSTLTDGTDVCMYCKSFLPHPILCPSTSFISTCSIHHDYRRVIMIHKLPSFHPSLISCCNVSFTSSTYVHTYVHLLIKCTTLPTSSPLQFLHTLSSLLKQCCLFCLKPQLCCSSQFHHIFPAPLIIRHHTTTLTSISFSNSPSS